jgi:hypothetical protein
MKPFAVKIWIAGCCALHTSTAGELTTIVPKRVFPDPAKRRSRRPPTGGDTAWVELDAGAFVDGVDVDCVGTFPGCAVEAVFDAPAEVPATVLVGPPLGAVV